MIYDPAIADSSFHRATSEGEINLWPIFDRIRCPTRVVRGELSDLLSGYRALDVGAGRTRIVSRFPASGTPMFMDEAQIAIARFFRGT